MQETSTCITVTALTFAIKHQLEGQFASVSVQGEISNAKLHASGHLYFDLKDAGAKIGAVCFRPQCQALSRLPKEGDQVTVQGALSVYPPHGKYQLIVRSFQYQGTGALLLQLEALKRKLQALGWFDKEKKKPLPKFPRTIGVITSPTGAVIRDMIHVLSRRFSGFHLILNPVRVQGNEAPLEIAQAIEAFNQYGLADVLIVGRGGGSLEDLWAFNDERVAKAIFESQIPIISAVGHETDVTLSDFVADIRAPTPSAAAEIVSAEKKHHLDFLVKTRKSLTLSLTQSIKQVRAQLKSYQRLPLFSSPFSLLAEPLQKMDTVQTRLEGCMQATLLKKRYALAALAKQAAALKPTTQLSFCKNRASQLKKWVEEGMLNSLKTKRLKIKDLEQKLQSLDPKNVLKRGYSILFDEKGGSVIVSAQTILPGQKVRALLSEGSAQLTVNSIHE